MRSYSIRPAVSDTVRDALSGYDELTQELLATRGVTDAASAHAFLNPSYEEHLHDPFLLPDMEKAVSRVAQAVSNKETICIYSDYDCDGIPGGALLHDAFRRGGVTTFFNYVPHRAEEGYGLNVGAIEKIKERGATLMITVDCGITDTAQVAFANSLGIDVIVTDHHLPIKKEDAEKNVVDDLPPAYAVIDHKRADNKYPFPEICGAATAWKLVCALAQRGVLKLKEGEEKWLLDLAGIATVADMMPLVGENRALAHYGLIVLRKSRRPGIQQLMKVMKADQRHLTEDDIGFSIAPRVNAASRMDKPEDALNLLLADNDTDAGVLAAHLDHINNERKGVVAHMAKDIKSRIKKTELRDVIVMGNPDWKPSLLGLAANSLVDEYKRPVFLWGRESATVLKGSCRSDGSVDVVALMSVAKESFVQFGGHKFSGGFSVNFDAVHVLEERLVAAFHTMNREDVVEIDYIDRELLLKNLRQTYATVKRFAPFGEANRKPQFLVKDALVEKVAWFGKGNEHVRFTISDGSGGKTDAIIFFAERAHMGVNPRAVNAGARASFVVTLEESFFRDRAELRLRVHDIL